MKKLELEQLKYSLTKNKTSTIFLLLLFILSISFMIYAISFYYSVSIKKETVEQAYNKNYYQLYDNFVGEAEEDFSNEKDNLLRLKNFYNEMNECNDFSFFTIINQPVYIKDVNVKEQFYYGYENTGKKQIIDVNEEENNYHCLKCVQINKNVIDEFNLKTETEKEYIDNWDNISIEDSCIPIILGNNYKSEFKLNQEFRILYLSKFINAKVIGFFDNGANIYSNGDMLYLDSYIVMPSFNFKQLPKTEEEKSLQLSMYLQKSAGVISSTLSANDVQGIINQMAEKYDLTLYTVKEADISNIKIFRMEANTFSLLLLSISIIIVILSSIGLSLTLSSKIEENISTYAIHLLTGASLSDIKKYILLEVITIIVLSIIFAIILAGLLCNFKLYHLEISIIICIIVSVIACIYPLGIINKMSLNEILKRNE